MEIEEGWIKDYLSIFGNQYPSLVEAEMKEFVKLLKEYVIKEEEHVPYTVIALTFAFDVPNIKI